MYFSVAQEVRLHTSALLSHRPGKETNPSSVVLSISPHQRSPPPPKTRKPLGNRIHHLTRLRGRATGGRQGEAHRLPCVRTSPSPRNSSASGAGGREKGEARGGRAAHHRRHKPRGDLTKEGGVGGNGAAAAAQRTPRRRPELSGGTKAPAPLPPARSPRGRAAVGGGGGGGRHGRGHEAGRPAGGHTCDLAARGTGEPRALGYLRRRGVGSQRRVPAAPGPGPITKGERGGPAHEAGGTAPRRPFARPPPRPTHTPTPHPRVTVVSNGLICSPARSSSIAAPPRSPGRETRNGRRTASRGRGCAAGCLAEAGGVGALRTGRPRLLRRAGGRAQTDSARPLPPPRARDRQRHQPMGGSAAPGASTPPPRRRPPGFWRGGAGRGRGRRRRQPHAGPRGGLPPPRLGRLPRGGRPLAGRASSA